MDITLRGTGPPNRRLSARLSISIGKKSLSGFAMRDSSRRSIADLFSRHLAASTFLVIAILELLEAVAGLINSRVISRLSPGSESNEAGAGWPSENALLPAVNTCRRVGAGDRRRPLSLEARQFARSGKKERRAGGERRLAVPVM